MINQKIFNSFFVNKFLIINLFIIFVAIFFLEFLYFLPSPTGDDLWFLKLSFNICRDNLFVSTDHSVFKVNAEALPWTTHGWFNQYLMAKLNFNCSLKGIFIFSFFVKIFSSILIYLILKDKKLKFIYTFILILLTLSIQLKLQFRPESFSIFLYLLLIYIFFRNYFFIFGILLAVIFFTQPIICFFICLFGSIIYFNQLIINYNKILLGIFLSSSLLIYIYPYSFFDFLNGLWHHKSALEGSYTLLDGGINQVYLKNLVTYFIKTTFLPFFGILFLYSYFFLIFKQRLLIFTIPFIFFFGPNTPMANYYLICLTPLLLILLTKLTNSKSFNSKKTSYLFSLTLIVSILGLSQYFLRNISTVFYYSEELDKTKKFLLTNKNKIEIYPGFSFMLDKSLKFVSLGNKNKEKIDSNLKIYSINGYRNRCIENINYKNKSQEIKIFSKKIFNSNSGYGIWVCD